MKAINITGPYNVWLQCLPAVCKMSEEHKQNVHWTFTLAITPTLLISACLGFIYFKALQIVLERQA